MGADSVPLRELEDYVAMMQWHVGERRAFCRICNLMGVENIYLGDFTRVHRLNKLHKRDILSVVSITVPFDIEYANGLETAKYRVKNGHR